jgi:hypothetical protein
MLHAQADCHFNPVGTGRAFHPFPGLRRYSDDACASWITNAPTIRAEANYLMWLDREAAGNRLYRVQDAGM